MASVQQIQENLKRLLTDPAIENLARETGFIRRQRKLTGRHFLALMTFGALEQPQVSYTALAQWSALLGSALTPQALEQRFTAEAATFLRRVLEQAVQQVIEATTPKAIPILQRFEGVFLRDSTVIGLPEELHALWPGCGGTQGPTAGLKVQVFWNIVQGHLQGLSLHPAKHHDRTIPYGPDHMPPGSLSIADLGYFSLQEFVHFQRQGKFFLSRYKVGTALFTPQGQRLDLVAWLKRQPRQAMEIPVLLGAKPRLPVRLLIYPVPPEVAAQRRRRLREYARKKQVPLKKETLYLAEWVLVVTNVPQERLGLTEAVPLLRMRWQIELLFRLWKSRLHVDQWRSQKRWRILSEIYGKLIAIVVTHWLLLLGWAIPDLSLDKAVQAVQKMVVPLALALYRGEPLEELFRLLQTLLQKACHQNKRRRQPATFQMLSALQPLS